MRHYPRVATYQDTTPGGHHFPSRRSLAALHHLLAVASRAVIPTFLTPRREVVIVPVLLCRHLLVVSLLIRHDEQCPRPAPMAGDAVRGDNYNRLPCCHHSPFRARRVAAAFFAPALVPAI